MPYADGVRKGDCKDTVLLRISKRSAHFSSPGFPQRPRVAGGYGHLAGSLRLWLDFSAKNRAGHCFIPADFFRPVPGFAGGKGGVSRKPPLPSPHVLNGRAPAGRVGALFATERGVVRPEKRPTCKTLSGRGSDFDLDFHAAGQLEFHQRVDGLGGRAVDVEDAFEGRQLELLA